MFLYPRVEYPAQAKQLDADTHQKLFMSFYVKSAATSEAMKVHQVNKNGFVSVRNLVNVWFDTYAMYMFVFLPISRLLCD